MLKVVRIWVFVNLQLWPYSTTKRPQLWYTSCWFQSISKIWVKLDHFARQVGVKIRNVWNHPIYHWYFGILWVNNNLPIQNLWNSPRDSTNQKDLYRSPKRLPGLIVMKCLKHRCLPPRKLRRQWKIPIFNRKYIFQWLMFHCHVSFRGSNSIKKINSNQIFQKNKSSQSLGKQYKKKTTCFWAFWERFPYFHIVSKVVPSPPEKKSSQQESHKPGCFLPPKHHPILTLPETNIKSPRK